jgi:hypothetical protein
MAYGNYAPFYRPNYFNPMQEPVMPNIAENQQQYMPQYQPSIQAAAPIQSQPANDMIWVLNENEATSYPVAPNNSVVLWDKNNPTIYIKSVNANGVPSMRVLDFTERSTDASNLPVNAPKTHECSCGDKFATKEQINDLRGKIDDITAKYEELSKSIVEKTKTTSKKVKESEE